MPKTMSIWRAFFWLIAAIGLPLDMAHAAKDTIIGWKLARDDVGLCIIASEYRVGSHPDVESAIAMAATDDLTRFQISFLRTDYDLTLGAVYEVDLSIDRRWRGIGSVEIIAPTMFNLTLPLTPDFLEALMRGATLQVHGRRSTVSITLMGTRHAVPALIACLTDAGPREQGINPFDGTNGPDDMM